MFELWFGRKTRRKTVGIVAVDKLKLFITGKPSLEVELDAFNFF